LRGLTTLAALWLGLASPLAGAAPRLSLEALEQRWAASDPAAASRLAVNEREAQAALAASESGWRAFAGSRGSYEEEPLANADSRDYFGWSAQAGLRLPLLGAHRSEHERELAADLAAADARGDYRAARRLTLNQLRRDYVRLWHLQARRRLERAHLRRAAAIRRWLNARLEAGEILASRRQPQVHALAESERWLETAGSLAAQLRRRLARQAGMSRRQWQAAHPRLARRVQRPPAVALADTPERRQARERAALTENLPEPRWHDTVDADLRFLGRVFEERDRDGLGQELAIAFSVEAPLQARAALSALRERHRARRRAAAAELDEARSRSRRRLEQAWFTLQQRAGAAAAAADARSAAALAAREQYLRAERLGDSAAAAWLDARLTYRRAAIAALDRERERLLAAVDYLAAADHGAAQGEAAAAGAPAPMEVAPLSRPPPWSDQPAPPAARPAPPRGTYLWDSQALFQRQRRDRLLERLQSAGVQRVLVGLTAAQTALPQAVLAAGLRAAERAGLEPWLLLGEPTWISPEGRQRLLDLIRRLSGLPAAGLHLDIEPVQLPGPVTATRLRHWLATLRAAATASPWPLALSLHPRWLEEAGASDPCVPCALAALDSDALVLMIYRRDPGEVIHRLRAIRERHPALPLGLAQSVEPQLPGNATHAGRTPAALQAALRRLEAAGATAPGGLYLQDWQAYQGMQP